MNDIGITDGRMDGQKDDWTVGMGVLIMGGFRVQPMNEAFLNKHKNMAKFNGGYCLGMIVRRRGYLSAEAREIVRRGGDCPGVIVLSPSMDGWTDE